MGRKKFFNIKSFFIFCTIIVIIIVIFIKYISFINKKPIIRNVIVKRNYKYILLWNKFWTDDYYYMQSVNEQYGPEVR